MSSSTGTVIFEDATLQAVEIVADTVTLNNFSVSSTTSLQQATNVSNVTTNTVRFTNPTTAFVTTGNVEVGRDLTVTSNVEVGGRMKGLVDNIVAEYTFASDGDSVEFTNLDLDGDGGTYKIMFKVRNPASANPAYQMFVNGDTTTTNYYYGGKQHTNTESTYNGNAPTIFGAGQNSTHTLDITMTRSAQGYVVAHGQGNFHTSANLTAGSVQGWSLSRWFYNTPGNVTSITFSADSTGKYATGSTITIYKYL